MLNFKYLSAFLDVGSNCFFCDFDFELWFVRYIHLFCISVILIVLIYKFVCGMYHS